MNVVELVQIAVGLAVALPTPAAVRPMKVRSDTVCSLANASGRGAIVSIPFRNVDGRVYVSARVNGRGPFTFAVDSGASGMARADIRLVAALKLQPEGRRETSDGITTAAVPTVRLATVGIGRLKHTSLDVITRDYNRNSRPEAAIAGILGREFFADGLLVIDYRRNRLIFTQSRSLASGIPGAVAYARPFRVRTLIGAVETLGNVDTGANVAVVVPRPLFEAASAGQTGEERNGTLTNTTIRTFKATLSVPVRIGDLVLTEAEARVSGNFPELLIGGPALTGSALLIDQRSHTLAICPPRRR